jgi:hypothetical protein
MDQDTDNNNKIEVRLDRLFTLLEETLLVRKEDKEYRERHSEEHRFLRSLIEEHEYSTQFKRELVKKITAGGLWALIIAISSSIMFSIKQWLVA